MFTKCVRREPFFDRSMVSLILSKSTLEVLPTSIVGTRPMIYSNVGADVFWSLELRLRTSVELPSLLPSEGPSADVLGKLAGCKWVGGRVKHPRRSLYVL